MTPGGGCDPQIIIRIPARECGPSGDDVEPGGSGRSRNFHLGYRTEGSSKDENFVECYFPHQCAELTRSALQQLLLSSHAKSRM
jgi:hypothetical protein